MISVLLPSRGRQDSLRRSVSSLRERCTGPIEVLVAVDADDTEAVHDAARDVADRLWISPIRHGYAGLHHYFNHLAAVALGRWLLLWNDDATMLTDAWDARIAALPRSVWIADLQSQHSPHFVAFPAVRSWVIEQVGAFSPHNSHCDSYWQQIGTSLGVLAPVDVHVHHDRYDVTGGHDDPTYRQQHSGSHSADFHSATVQALIAADVARLRAHQPGQSSLLGTGTYPG